MENIFAKKSYFQNIWSRETNSIRSISTIYADKILLLRSLHLPPLAVKLLPLASNSILELVMWLLKTQP